MIAAKILRTCALALVFVFGIAGCSVPALDRTGAIRAGNAGTESCPDGYVERWGRCCPPDSSLSECPATLERDTTGARFEPVGCSCPSGTVPRGAACCPASASGDGGSACTSASVVPQTGCTCPATYELRFGHCCPRDAGAECPPREIGAPCQVNEDCGLPIGANDNLRPYCHLPSTFANAPVIAPHGYCSVRDCMTDADCGPNATCLNFFGLLRLCARSCTFAPGETSAACPLTNGEYSCHRLQQLGNSLQWCFPDCTMDPTVCQGDYRCFGDLHYCATPCSVAGDNLRCQTQGFARCNVAMGHCEY